MVYQKIKTGSGLHSLITELNTETRFERSPWNKPGQFNFEHLSLTKVSGH
ncbi:hypothetical protein B7P43_G02905 [Cryptotermes secundus]|uniref:Uncharacterized protein n=1 Tax=Cryptotermes secundus TaxID=105785 RepID=A0A2J7Q0V9_9NEOP|nr:hypothetical protein B7P43_G02905 [Cryptotermes secundus]